MKSDTAVLLINLGTPASFAPEDVGRYLEEFLTDPEVIDLPWVFREILVRFLIVPRRKFRSAELYKRIWTPQGSPLAVHMQDLLKALRASFPDHSFFHAYRYGPQSLSWALDQIEDAGFRSVVFFPLYPQYATSSTRTVFNRLKELRAVERFERSTWTTSYHDQDFYLDSVARMIQKKWQPGTHVVFSYHGVPERHITRNHSDCQDCLRLKSCAHLGAELCYRRQCSETSWALARRIGLSDDQWSLSFQSRLGRAKWLEPSTEAHILKLVADGRTDLTLVTPGFASDCLETLEEIDSELREKFLGAGGEKWTRIACLNSEPHWVQNLGAHLIQEIQDLQRELTTSRSIETGDSNA